VATAGVPLAATIVVIDSQVVVAAALALGVLVTALCVRALLARRLMNRVYDEAPLRLRALDPRTEGPSGQRGIVALFAAFRLPAWRLRNAPGTERRDRPCHP